LLKADPQLASAAFRLSSEMPTSDPVQTAEGFYVLHLNGIDPAQPLTLEQARPKVVETLKTQRVRELVAAKGAEAKQKIAEALKPGAPVEAALQQTGMPVEKLEPFALSDPPTPKAEPGKEVQPEAPDLQMIKSSVAELNPGEVSEVIPTENGAVIAVLESREQPAPAIYEAGKQMFQARFLQGKQELAFYEWLRERRREAGVQMNSGAADDAAAAG
jgi:parvulin-like peptidyl-prolyl isomerase